MDNNPEIIFSNKKTHRKVSCAI